MKTFMIKRVFELTQIVEAESIEEVEKCKGLIDYNIIKQNEVLISRDVTEVVIECRIVDNKEEITVQ